MTFAQIIQDNCAHHSPVSWWPKLAFHYTDVTNAVSILSSGRLYSRSNAQFLGVMKNENASRQVIDMTQTQATANVRFYFRPLTPTQYHNEGYKHPLLRYAGDEGANMPVPVFFAFDLEKLLSMPGIRFSEKAQSGHGAELYSTPEEFSRFHFDYIYGKGFDENWKETLKYRHAELLYPDHFDIHTCLNAVLCRNAVEQTTLLNLLFRKNQKHFYQYAPLIKVCRKDMFENNGLFITGCQYFDNTISVSFSSTNNKKQHTRKEMERQGIASLPPITLRLELEWTKGIAPREETLRKLAAIAPVDYQNPQTITFANIPAVPGTRTLHIRIYFNGSIMCYHTQLLAGGDVIK